jgi:signal peptidase
MGLREAGLRRQRWWLFGLLATLSGALLAVRTVQPRTPAEAPRPPAPPAPKPAAREAPTPPVSPRRFVARWAWMGVVGYAIAAYFIVYELIAGRTNAETNLYILQPLIWGSLAALSLFLWWHTRRESDIPMGRVLFFAAWAAGFHIAVLIGAGLVYGFGHSPFAREPWHMVQNGFYLTTLILGIECARAYLLNTFYPRSPFISMVLVSAFFAVLLVPVTNFYLLDSTEPALRLTGETLLPGLAVSVVASYLAVHGGPLPAFLYHGGVLAFEWFSPILPHLDWIVAAFVETMAPLLALVAVRGVLQKAPAPVWSPDGGWIAYLKAFSRQEQTEQRFDVSLPWVVATAIGVALLWFNAGLLGVTPSVVNGVSMEPAMHTGDLAMTRDVDPGDLAVGDIVVFRAGHSDVIHRIIEIEETAQGRVFVTQGDNNNTPDDPILEGQVVGEVVFTMPKVGWIPIYFGELVQKLGS